MQRLGKIYKRALFFKIIYLIVYRTMESHWGHIFRVLLEKKKKKKLITINVINQDDKITQHSPNSYAGYRLYDMSDCTQLT